MSHQLLITGGVSLQLVCCDCLLLMLKLGASMVTGFEHVKELLNGTRIERLTPSKWSHTCSKGYVIRCEVCNT